MTPDELLEALAYDPDSRARKMRRRIARKLLGG